MEGCPKTPMINFDLKEPVPIDNSFEKPLLQYIQAFYHEDPNSYKNEIQQITNLRKNIGNIPHDIQGCKSLRRYFTQLYYLQSRFPMYEGGEAGVPFVWYDVYNSDPVMYEDIRYEQACVLFNIGGLYSQLASKENRTTEESLKTALQHFKSAAGAYQYLKDNYLLTDFVDMTEEILALKIKVMLGQAVECILEKSILDNKNPTSVARISTQIASTFNDCVDLLSRSGTAEMGSDLRKSWTKHLKVKILSYEAISHLYMATDANQQEKFGEKVTYLKAASEKINEALKLLKNQVDERINFIADVIQVQYEDAVKNNDFIYHMLVPDIATMESVKGIDLAKPVPFPYDDKDVAGPDIFQRLVPMKAHEASSLYSEKKAHVLREVSKEVEEKDVALSQFLSAMKVEDLLDPKQDVLPDDLQDKNKFLRDNPDVIPKAERMVEELASLSSELDGILKESKSMLDEEIALDVQENSGKQMGILKEMEKELNQCINVHTEGQTINMKLVQTLIEKKNTVQFLSREPQVILESLPPLHVIDNSVEEPLVQRLREILGKVEKMKTQRQNLLSQLREELNKDDVTAELVVLKDSRQQESFFEEQIKKHDKTIAYLKQNLAAQENIIQALTEANAKYALTREKELVNKERFDNKVKFYLNDVKLFLGVQDKIRSSGLIFFKDLQKQMDILHKKIIEFSNERKKKRPSKNTHAPSRPTARKPKLMGTAHAPIPPSPIPHINPITAINPQFPDSNSLQNIRHPSNPSMPRAPLPTIANPSAMIRPNHQIPQQPPLRFVVPNNNPQFRQPISQVRPISISSEQPQFPQGSRPPFMPNGSQNFRQPSQNVRHPLQDQNAVMGVNQPQIQNQQPNLPRHSEANPALFQPPSSNVVPNWQTNQPRLNDFARRMPNQQQRPTAPDQLRMQRPSMQFQNQSQPRPRYPQPNFTSNHPHIQNPSTVISDKVPFTNSNPLLPMSSGDSRVNQPISPELIYPRSDERDENPLFNPQIIHNQRQQPPLSQQQILRPQKYLPQPFSPQQSPSTSMQQPFQNLQPRQSHQQILSQQQILQPQQRPLQPQQQLLDSLQQPLQSQKQPLQPQIHPQQLRLQPQQQPMQPQQQQPPLQPQQQNLQPRPLESQQQQPLQPQQQPFQSQQKPLNLQQQQPFQRQQQPFQSQQQHLQSQHQHPFQQQQPLQPQQKPFQSQHQHSQVQQQPLKPQSITTEEQPMQPQRPMLQGQQSLQALNSQYPQQLSLRPQKQQQPIQTQQQASQVRQQTIQGQQQQQQQGISGQLSSMHQHQYQQVLRPVNRMANDGNPLQAKEQLQPNSLSYQQQQQQQAHPNLNIAAPNLQPLRQPDSPTIFNPTSASAPSLLDSDNIITPRFTEPSVIIQQNRSPIIGGIPENDFKLKNTIFNPQSPQSPKISQFQDPLNLRQYPGRYQISTPIGIQHSQPSAPPMLSAPTTPYSNQFVASVPQPFVNQTPVVSTLPATLLTGKPLMSSSQHDPIISNILGKPPQSPNVPISNYQAEQMNQFNLQQFQLQQALMYQNQQQMFTAIMQSLQQQHKSEEEVKLHNLETEMASIKELLKSAAEQRSIKPNEHDSNEIETLIKALIMKQDQHKSISTESITPGKQLINHSTSPIPPTNEVNKGSLSPDVILPRSLDISDPLKLQRFEEVNKNSVANSVEDIRIESNIYSESAMIETNTPNSDQKNKTDEEDQVKPRDQSKEPKSESEEKLDTNGKIPNTSDIPTPILTSSDKSVQLNTPSSPDELILPRKISDSNKDHHQVPKEDDSNATQPKEVNVKNEMSTMRSFDASTEVTNLNESCRFTPIDSPSLRKKLAHYKSTSLRSTPRSSPNLSARSSTRSSPILTANGQVVQLDDMDNKENRQSDVIDHRHLARQLGRLSFYVGEPDEATWRKHITELAVQVEKFSIYCKSLCKPKANTNIDGFKQIWDDLAKQEQMDIKNFTATIGEKNVSKNRYRDILPWDHSRVKLTTLPNDYINATHIENLTPQSPPYIATQGPIPQTFEDFWTMIWEQRSTVIVMLTNEIEGHKLKCHPYWSRDMSSMKVEVIDEKQSSAWKIRNLRLTNQKENDTRFIKHFQFTSWPDYGTPESPYELLSFMEEVHVTYNMIDPSSTYPIILHCSAGVGRTGSFCCIYSAIRELEGQHGLIEIPGVIRKLRQCRQFMVQRMEQMIFCFQAICCFAQQFIDSERLKLQENSRQGSLQNSGVFEEETFNPRSSKKISLTVPLQDTINPNINESISILPMQPIDLDTTLQKKSLSELSSSTNPSQPIFKIDSDIHQVNQNETDAVEEEEK